MSSTKFFRVPWAMSGDKTDIPETAQVDGSVSYPEGFGADYELELGVDAAAKPVPRPESNQLYYDLTSNVRAWQLAGAPEWVTAAQNGGVAVTYPKAAIVRHDQSGAFLAYFADVATSAEPGTSADWSVVPTKDYIDTKMAQPWFRLSGRPGSIPSGVNTTLTGWSASASGNLEGTLSASAGTFTVGADDAGTWVLSVATQTTGASTVEVIIIAVDGAFVSLQGSSSQGGASNCLEGSTSAVVRLNAGDVVSCLYYQNSGSTQTMGSTGASHFSGCRVGM